MTVTISAVRDGKDITFQIAGRDAQEVFRQWQAGPLAKGCTRAALGNKPAPVAQRDMPLISLSDGLRDGWEGYTHTLCQECGVTTHSVTGGDYVRKAAVHRNGCKNIVEGDLIIAPPLK